MAESSTISIPLWPAPHSEPAPHKVTFPFKGELIPAATGFLAAATEERFEMIDLVREISSKAALPAVDADNI